VVPLKTWTWSLPAVFVYWLYHLYHLGLVALSSYVWSCFENWVEFETWTTFPMVSATCLQYIIDSGGVNLLLHSTIGPFQNSYADSQITSMKFLSLFSNHCGSSENVMRVVSTIHVAVTGSWTCVWLSLFVKPLSFLVLFSLFCRVWFLLFMLPNFLLLCYQSEVSVLCNLISSSSLNSIQVESYGENCQIYLWRLVVWLRHHAYSCRGSAMNKMTMCLPQVPGLVNLSL